MEALPLDPPCGAETTAAEGAAPERRPRPLERPDEPVAARAAEPVREIGRFRVEGLLGEGGMGRVYAAWDPQLRRRVAVKVLRRGDPEAEERFVVEARAQARIRHPGICPVFEVGDAGGAPYIAMQLIEGRPLDVTAAAGLSLEGKLGLLAQVAEAVHAAHREGLIHRDLKPANILVEGPSEEAPARPVVLDFGLARLAEGGATRSGQALGTPAYMAPEQVRGEIDRLDRRTDVYALGATLYRVLSGRPPFTGGDLAAALASLDREAPPLRPLGVPVDVEAIVFKCLEKEPARRYGSALALAEDLRRFLDGRPVLARPAGRWHRLRRWARRRRAPVAVAGAGALLLALSLAWGGVTAWRARDRERFAQRFTEQLAEVEAQVRYSHLAPLHDVRPDRALLRARLEAIAAEMERAGRIGLGPGHLALGRGHLALERLEPAVAHLERAWDAGHRTPETAAALAVTLSALYRERIAALELAGDWGGRRRELDLLERRFQEPARRFLAAARAEESARRPSLAGAAGAPAGAIDDLVLDVLTLLHDDRFADALARLEAFGAGHAWSYELPRLEGEVRRTWAVALAASGEDRRAREQLDRARAAYARAIAVAPSDPGLARADAQASYQRLSLEVVGGEPLPLVEQGAFASLARALAADPDDSRTWLWQARLHRLLAQADRVRARDPEDHLEQALAALRRAGELGAADSTVAEETARVHWSRAQWQNERGGDARAALSAAVDALGRVAEADRGYAYWNTLAMAQTTLGDQQAARGAPALDAYEAAAAAFRAAIREHSAPFGAWSNLGLGLLKISEQPEVAEPVPVLLQAVAAFERASALRLEHPVPLYYLGRCHLRLAQGGRPASGRLDAGPPGSVDRALGAYRRALERAPEMFQLHSGLGEVLHLQALEAWDRGRDPEPLFAAARAAYDNGLAIAPDHPVLLLNLAWTAYFQGKLRVRSGIDPGGSLDEAVALARRAAQAGGGPFARLCEGSARRLQAERAAAVGNDPAAAISAADAAFLAVLPAAPAQAEARRSLGRLATLEAEWRSRRGLPADASFARARDELDRALALAPDLPDFHLARARWSLAWGRWRRSRGAPDPAALGAGRAAAARALALRPRWREALEVERSLGEEARLSGPPASAR